MSLVFRPWYIVGVSALTLGACVLAIRFRNSFEAIRTQERHSPFTRNVRRQYPSYTYEPLGDASSKNIRLIELLPGPEEDPDGIDVLRPMPHIRMRTISLLESPIQSYEAISYCWGTPSQLYPVFCDDGTVAWVTDTLYWAFWGLRLKDRSRLLWADALCIDQTNVKEKNWQVLQMADVYRNATRVIVWLGEPQRDFKRLIDYVPQLVKAKELMEAEECVLNWDQLPSEQLRRYGLPTNSLELSRLCGDLIALTEAPWFERVWVVQEFVVAREVYLAYGDWGLRWDDLQTAYDFAGDKCLFWASGYTFRWSRMDQLIAFKKTWSEDTEGSTLFYHLSFNRSTLATNQLDHVYALVGLASDRILFKIDYAKSVSEAYWEATRNVLLNSQQLSILACAGHDSSNKLPSWVCDWRTRTDSVLIPDWTYTCPSNWSELDLGPEDIDRKLHLKGFKLDAVSAISIPNAPFAIQNTFRLVSDTRARTVYAEWFEFCGAHSPNVYELTGESLIDVFSQLLIVETAQDESADFIKGRTAQVLPFIQFLHNTKRFLPLRKTWKSYKAAMYIFQIFWEFVIYPLTASGDDRYMDVDYVRDLARNSGRTMIRTTSGLLGMAPTNTQVDDGIFILKGGRTPFVLRETDEEDEYLLIGECYIHGAMDGKFWNEEKCHNIKLV
jgi:Heterokaryon incompatibility protein (HET)